MYTNYVIEEFLKENNFEGQVTIHDGARPFVSDKIINKSIEEAKNEGLTLMTLDSFLNKYKEARDFKIYLEIKNLGK